MAIQVTIIGLGQIGSSIGMSLGEHKEKFHRIGHDLDLRIARQAEKSGAVDKVAINLPSSVQNSDIVLLCLPIDQVRETLELISPELREDVVVMDTAPVKEVVAAWAGELLPEKRHYVGLTPVINPAYLHELESGLEAAHADLFRKGMIAIVSPPKTPSEAIKLAADLTRLLGAEPLFVDPLEVDGLMASTHIVPQLLSAALLNATIDQPGWREARKVAGRAYAEVTSPSSQLSEPKTLSRSALLNRENVLRSMDAVIAALQSLRGDLESEDEQALLLRLDRARDGRDLWWKQRQAADWAGEEIPRSESPSGSDIFSRMVGLGRRKKPKDKN